MGKYPNLAIICGGKGTRLAKALPDQPKSMAPIHGRPFLDLLLDFFSSAGFRRIILCVGYKAESIQQYYAKSPFSSSLIFSEEKELLGTGGALKAAEHLFTTEDVVVANGDSYCGVDCDALLAFHATHSDGIASIVLTASKGRRDGGDVVIDEVTGRITAFREKGMQDARLVNAGIYCLRRSVLAAIPGGSMYSLEYELFPNLLSQGLYGFVTESPCIDIGTPERYATALNYFSTMTK